MLLFQTCQRDMLKNVHTGFRSRPLLSSVGMYSYQLSFSYWPIFPLSLLSGNHSALTLHDSRCIWLRMFLLPFDVALEGEALYSGNPHHMVCRPSQRECGVRGIVTGFAFNSGHALSFGLSSQKLEGTARQKLALTGAWCLLFGLGR